MRRVVLCLTTAHYAVARLRQGCAKESGAADGSALGFPAELPEEFSLRAK